MYSRSMSAFSAPQSPADYFEQIRNRISNDISNRGDNEILNCSPETYAEYLSEEYKLYPAVLHDEDMTMSDHDDDIPASRFPPEFSIVDRNGTIKRPVIVFHLPFQPGDAYFFKLLSPATMAKPQFSQSEILLEYVDFYGKPEKIKALFSNDLDALRLAFNHLAHHYSTFNAGVKAFALREINGRREKALRRANYLASFNIPLKANESAPKTFSIPDPKLREKIVVNTPEFSNAPFVPEPALDYSVYQKILKAIDDMGRNFERMPSLYSNKDEESLRDHILSILDPNFQMGSATGETFNKAGKTDILLRYDSSVAFIAECKFWTGIQGFYKTIDQLLSYLTWRDSKAAIVLFVPNKEFTSVINDIKDNISQHPEYIRQKAVKAENWLEYNFCLPGDPQREIFLTILAFHIPSKAVTAK
jgi:hypothetical protein